MTQIIVLPHVELCPDGAVIEAAPGTSICDALLGSDIEIEHACEKSCACTTCHVVVREGFNTLARPRIWRRTCWTRPGAWSRSSRLSCQALVGQVPLVIEIPKYTINMVKEGHSKK
jgi:2Fe-2S ferredoxin